MKKDLLVKALGGAMALGQLTEEGSYVLAMISKKESYIIPLLKKDSINIAYVDPALYSDAQYIKINELITCINDTKVYPIKKFTVKSAAAPEFDKTVKGFVKPVGVKFILPKNTQGTLESAGYTVLDAATGGLPFQGRDYGTQVADDANFQRQFDEEKQELDDKHIRYDKFTDCPALEIAYELGMVGAKQGVLFVGPAGVGKTTAATRIATRAKAHKVYYQISPATLPEDLEGKYVPNDEPGAQTNWKFVEGPVLEAWSKGYFLYIDELNFALAGTNSCLNKYLDGTLQIKIDGKVYHKHPNFFFAAGMNAGYEDTEKLNQALKNRYSIVQFEPLSENEFINRLVDHSKYVGHEISVAFAKEIFKFGGFMHKNATSGQWHEQAPFGYRNAERFIDDILVAPRNLALFTESIHLEYTNLLSCDNDNSDKLMAFKKSEELTNYIKKLYDLYDFSTSEVATELPEDLDTFFAADEVAGESEKTSEDEKIMDSLFDRFNI